MRSLASRAVCTFCDSAMDRGSVGFWEKATPGNKSKVPATDQQRSLRCNRPDTPPEPRCIGRKYPTRQGLYRLNCASHIQFWRVFSKSPGWVPFPQRYRGSDESCLHQKQKSVRRNMQIEIDQAMDQQSATSREGSDTER